MSAFMCFGACDVRLTKEDDDAWAEADRLLVFSKCRFVAKQGDAYPQLQVKRRCALAWWDVEASVDINEKDEVCELQGG